MRRGRAGMAVGALVLLGSLVLAGCAVPRLEDERRQEPYASLAARSAGLSAYRLAVHLPEAATGGLGVRELRSPNGAARPVLVLQPGILADGSTWRFVMGALAEDHDLLAIDPPGTGLSDVPDPGSLRGTAYSPTRLAAHTAAALEAWQVLQPAPRRFVLVGHSLGGTVVLRLLADPAVRARHATLLERVDGVVLISPADLDMQRLDPKLEDIATLSDLKAALAAEWGILRREVREGVRANVIHPERDALEAEALRIEGLLGREPTRHAAQAMLGHFFPLDARLRPDARAAHALAEQERGIQQPVLLLWGEQDRTLPVSDAQAFLRRLPRARLHVVKGVGHSSHQEGVLEVAAEVRAFVASLAGVPAHSP